MTLFFIVKPSYLISKWKHFIRVPTYHEWQTSKCTTPCIIGTLEDLMKYTDC